MNCRWVQIFDEDLKHLVYSDYWRTKHWKRLLVLGKDAKAEIYSVELKFAS